MPKLKWTEAAIRIEAAKYKTKREFDRGSCGAYSACLKRQKGLIDELFDNVNQSWPETAIRIEAAKYNTKRQFELGSESAYKACTTRFKGLIDELFGGNVSWTESAIRKESAKYSTKKEFARGNSGAYQSCNNYHKGLIDELFDNVYKSWDEKSLRLEAAKYNSKAEFRRGSGGAYGACLKRKGLIDELFGNINRSWDEKSIRLEAAKYNSKAEFQRGSDGAYQSCKRRHKGLMEELFESHPNCNTQDCAYIWQAGADLYKIGITSDSLDNGRINEVARAGRFEQPVILRLVNVGSPVTAREVEKKLKAIGEVKQFPTKFDGCTEFRIMTFDEVNQAVKLIDLHATA